MKINFQILLVLIIFVQTTQTKVHYYNHRNLENETDPQSNITSNVTDLNSTNITTTDNITCDIFTDCYSCLGNYFIYEGIRCDWINSQCVNSTLNETKDFFEDYEQQCSDNSSLELQEKYCGEFNVSDSGYLYFTPPEYDSQFLYPNLLCIYVYNNSGLNSFYLEVDTFRFSGSKSPFIYYKASYNDESYPYDFSYVSRYDFDAEVTDCVNFTFYVFAFNSYETIPYSITIRRQTSSSKILLIIIVCLILGLIIACSVSIFIVSRKVHRHREEDMRRYANDYYAEIENERMKEKMMNRRREQLHEALEGQLKPQVYNKEMGNYNTNCSICLDNFKSTSKVCVTECKHVFHNHCIKKWINENLLDPKCPNCNSHILPELENMKNDAGAERGLAANSNNTGNENRQRDLSIGSRVEIGSVGSRFMQSDRSSASNNNSTNVLNLNNNTSNQNAMSNLNNNDRINENKKENDEEEEDEDSDESKDKKNKSENQKKKEEDKKKGDTKKKETTKKEDTKKKEDDKKKNASSNKKDEDKKKNASINKKEEDKKNKNASSSKKEEDKKNKSASSSKKEEDKKKEDDKKQNVLVINKKKDSDDEDDDDEDEEDEDDE